MVRQLPLETNKRMKLPEKLRRRHCRSHLSPLPLRVFNNNTNRKERQWFEGWTLLPVAFSFLFHLTTSQ